MLTSTSSTLTELPGDECSAQQPMTLVRSAARTGYMDAPDKGAGCPIPSTRTRFSAS